jgi:hypothetical protein
MRINIVNENNDIKKANPKDGFSIAIWGLNAFRGHQEIDPQRDGEQNGKHQAVNADHR